jgi:hypothetical protein
MNIEDFKPIRYSLETIFEKQKEIKFLYEPEARDIFTHFDIDTYEDQEIFKRYCWRITEELMEALEDRKNENHFREELIDGFNFLIELYLLYGWDLKNLPSSIQLSSCSVDEKVLKVVYQLGVTANLLRNRQWRRSQYLVDLYIFEARFKKIWENYLNIFYALGMSMEEVCDLWSLKYQVNLFRINSNY